MRGIERACFLIALDNGGINRNRSEKKQNRDFRMWLSGQDYPNMPEINEWLQELSDEELDLFCCGGTGEPGVEVIRSRAPAFTDDLLNAYFDDVC